MDVKLIPIKLSIFQMDWFIERQNNKADIQVHLKGLAWFDLRQDPMQILLQVCVSCPLKSLQKNQGDKKI